MSRVAIYMEGGGDGKGTKAELRKGTDAFLTELKNLARTRYWRWKIVCCGSREKTFREFRNEIAGAERGAVVVLLVDAEAPVRAAPRAHLSEIDGWRLDDTPDDSVHLMVQTMESWIVADPEALAEFYGSRFDKGALPRHADLEAVGKAGVARALDGATRRTAKGKYHKIRHAGPLLARIDPYKARRRCRRCERLFSALKRAILAPSS